MLLSSAAREIANTALALLVAVYYGRLRCSLGQDIGEVLSGVFAAGEEQRDFSSVARGYNACCENTGTFRKVFVLNDPVVFEKLQDLHGGIVVVEHVAIGSLTDQFIE